jgi:Na+/H+-dicarboxylate symporter
MRQVLYTPALQYYTFYMPLKTAVWTGMIIGSLLGQSIPSLWGAGIFSFSSIFLSTFLGLVGIWLGYKISR